MASEGDEDGMRHIYKVRDMYLDEDSWQCRWPISTITVISCIDVVVAHGNYYEVPTQWDTLEVFHDLQSLSLSRQGLDNQRYV